MANQFDAIIAGASFAGLSVAKEIDGDVVLLDRKPLGKFQTSACGTFPQTMVDVGCEGSILQSFDTAIFHVPNPVRIKLVDPLVTIDYEKFCKTMLVDEDRFRLAEVREVVGTSVRTSAGDFQSNCLVDCTGWRAALASSLRRDTLNMGGLAFGIEIDADYGDDDIHFIFDHRILSDGYAWIFPAGRTSRIGVGTFNGRSKLYPELTKFLSKLGLDAGPTHGGYIPFRPRPAIADNVFLVGDSAGHAVPFTLEGIRRSLWLGQVCGRIINRVIHGRMSLREGLKNCRRSAERGRLAYRFLSAQQVQFGRDRGSSLRLLLRLFRAKSVSQILQKAYFAI